MKDADSAYIIVGKIGATYGIKGWLKIHSFTEFGASILEYSPWYISNGDDRWQSIVVEEGKPHGSQIVAKLAGYETPEDARLLTGKTIAISRSQLPKLEKGEFYWSELEGLTVINKDGTVFGQVAYLIETGSNDVLVVKNDKEHAIPYLPGTVILNVDLVKREILVDWELI